MRTAKTVITIFGFTSTISSGSAYTLAPSLLAMEIPYLALAILSSSPSPPSTSLPLLSLPHCGKAESMFKV